MARSANPSEIKKIPPIYERIKKVREHRLKSKSLLTQKKSDIPHLFYQITKQSKKFLVIPRVSSENRDYIPIGFLDENFIASDQLKIISDAEIFHFGILTSSVHMIWTKTFCGRLRNGLRYSKDVIYNNFIWCECSEVQRKKICETAQKILDVRKKYSDATLADLYDPILMPKDLRDAHKKNDLAVLEAYGFSTDWNESEILAELMKLYIHQKH